MPELSLPETWAAFLQAVDAQIDRTGFWGGEARVLRDAAGLKRFGRSNGARVLSAIAAAGLECDEPELRYESQTVVIRRAGATALAATIADLLPAIRAADREVPSVAVRRDAVVARTAMRAWRPKRG